MLNEKHFEMQVELGLADDHVIFVPAYIWFPEDYDDDPNKWTGIQWVIATHSCEFEAASMCHAYEAEWWKFNANTLRRIDGDRQEPTD